MDYERNLVPLVLVSGFGTTFEQPETPYSTEKVVISTESCLDVPIAKVALDRLLAFGQEPAFWIERAGQKRPTLNYKLADEFRLYKKHQSDMHSPLSPLNSQSELYPNKLFSPKWLEKYLIFIPSSLVLWIALGPTDNTPTVSARIQKLKQTLEKCGTKLIVVLVNTSLPLEHVSQRSSQLQKATGLASKKSLFVLNSDIAPSEVDQFVKSLNETLINSVSDFYGLRSRKVRYKRNKLDSADVKWDVRYTFKLACLAELKMDLPGELRLLESTYDCMLEMAKANAFNVSKTPEWLDARSLLDAIALRIIRVSLYQGDFASVYRKFIIHISSVLSLLEHQDIDKKEYSTQLWLATSYSLLAKLVDCAKNSYGDSYWTDIRSLPDQRSFLPRPGFLHLQSYELYTAIKGSESTESKDAYRLNTTFNPQEALHMAFADLGRFPRSRAFLSIKYGELLMSQNNPNKAFTSYMDAVQALSNSPWAASYKEALEKAYVLAESDSDRAELSLSRLCVNSEAKVGNDLPKVKLGEINTQLFTVYGTFYHTSTFIGREARIQVKLVPLFKTELEVEFVKVTTSVGTITIQHNPSEISELPHKVESDGLANLTFKNGEPKVFEFTQRPHEEGEVELLETQISGASSVFLQTQFMLPSNDWWQRGVCHHLRPTRPSYMTVKTRPSRIRIVTEDMCTLAYTNETFPVSFDIANDEEEQVQGEVSVYLEKDEQDEQDEPPQPLHQETFEVASGAIHKVAFTHEVSKESFCLTVIAKYTIPSDPLPAKQTKTIQVRVQIPFRVNFDTCPKYRDAPWPNLFVPGDHCEPFPVIRHAWLLKATVLGLSEIPLHVNSRTMRVTSAGSTDMDLEDRGDLNSIVSLNGTFKTDTCFETFRENKAQRTSEVAATLSLHWSRAGSEDIVNTYTAPGLTLKLPLQDPRVLVTFDVLPESCLNINYSIENPTAHVLTLSVSIVSSKWFHFQGPKSQGIRMLPFTRRTISYCARSISATLNGKPLPEFRVFDTHYKKMLSVLPGTPQLYQDQGILKIQL